MKPLLEIVPVILSRILTRMNFLGVIKSSRTRIQILYHSILEDVVEKGMDIISIGSRRVIKEP